MAKGKLTDTGRPLVRITIPLPPDGEDGLVQDSVERVTVNGTKYELKRGFPMDVPDNVYIQLRNKYKNL